jgi:hypothetical protein
VTSTPHPTDPGSKNKKLGTAAEYLATQVASNKANAILPALGPRTARLAGTVRSAVRSVVRKARPVGVRGVAGEADAGGTTAEGER